MRQEQKGLKGKNTCEAAGKCGGCDFQGVPYEKQLAEKQKNVESLLTPFCKVHPIKGMEHPVHYRNKVHAVFGRTRAGEIISGVYEKNSHRIVPVEECMLEDEIADAIIRDIRALLKSFHIQVYDEDRGTGLLRHVLIRRGFATGEVLVVLVLSTPVLPSKNNFVNVLRKLHPEITSVVLNVNSRRTSMVLGDREIVLYGKGYIEDILCGKRFRISPKSFYQVNPVQTEYLYETAIRLSGLTGKETVIDVYCGIGTIGLAAAEQAGKVIGVELNADAVRDAILNCKQNGIRNARFYQGDAGEFMTDMAEKGERADVVFMDPPRAGSDAAFLYSLTRMAPERVVYISCNPETLARDLKYLTENGYKAEGAWPVDMFPWTEHIETCVLLSKLHTDHI